MLFTGCSRETRDSVPPAAKPSLTKEPAAVTTLLATIPDDEKPPKVAPSRDSDVHPAVPDLFTVVFSELGGGAAYIAEKNGKIFVVHNGRRDRAYGNVGTVALSPDGQRIAYGALSGGKWRMVVDGRDGRTYDALGTPVFSPDGQHVAYQAMLGERWVLVVDDTPNTGTAGRYIAQEFSADSKIIAYAEAGEGNTGEQLVVSDLNFNKQVVMKSCGAHLTVNTDRTRIAAVCKENGKQRTVELNFDSPDAATKGPLYDAIHALSFGPDNVSVAYVAERAGRRYLVLNKREEALPEGDVKGLPVVRPDLNAAGVAITSVDSAFLHEAFEPGKRRGKSYQDIEGLVYSRDGKLHAYAARTGHQSWVVVVNDKEGPSFDRVVSPIFSPDGKKVAYRARKDGKRFVVVADADGKTLRQHIACEQVFQPLFTADGGSIAYGMKDGNKLIWQVDKLE